MSIFFPECNLQLGFGIMRLPETPDHHVDCAKVQPMVDYYLANGGNYFDTSRIYNKGESETCFRTCVSSKYPRDRYLITDKLSSSIYKKQEEIRPTLLSQLESCGVEYFDFYLIHGIDPGNYQKFCDTHAFEELVKLKKEGLVRHIGFSFHDTPTVLEEILQNHPEMEVVQIQFNYMDYDSPTIQSKACYDICQKYGKPCFIMEPIKGGSLGQLNEKAQTLFQQIGKTPAELALRFAAQFEGNAMVLSGMSELYQVEENTKLFQHISPLTEEEQDVLNKVKEAVTQEGRIPCTGCHYCVAGCPQHIAIPEAFQSFNTHKVFGDWQSIWYYQIATKENGKVSSCVECGQCSSICPQHLPIPQLLKEVSEVLESEV